MLVLLAVEVRMVKGVRGSSALRGGVGGRRVFRKRRLSHPL